ncbi:hypothetical protein BO94DRAFT_546677 [Aspergillus sclerotioniger CBS 115572]|uniref:Uncharacterized protein n=1 Tax=Aspergillus sclerotioniger CBS 115572 TaxID=1450535 RepID=A0A317WN73_9EURO|nr:hypothetical protein BO94DRAFT_546677 [Aspergillus sclerotioniger CBS 115572]PWY86448.1 hypothetical protein BO94DRAFT_546677 [Aspergillus sclerotioniger CBS 115572]
MATAMQDDQFHSMPPTSGEGCRPPGDPYARAADPHSSVEDYSRVMLEYTQRRMADFADLDDDKGSFSRSSRSSQTSGGSGTSTSGLLARQAAGASSAAHDSPDAAGYKSGVN